MHTQIKSDLVTRFISNNIEYLEHDGKNGTVDDDTIITVVYKKQHGGRKDKIKLKDLIKKALVQKHRL